MKSLDNEISWSEIAYPQFQLFEKRVDSFTDKAWPISMSQNKIILAKAGFFTVVWVILLYVTFVVSESTNG